MHVHIVINDVDKVDVHVGANETDDVDVADVAVDVAEVADVEHLWNSKLNVNSSRHQASNLKLCFVSR